MADEEHITLQVIKPRHTIGQVIYIPQTNRVIDTKISGYEVKVIEEEGNLLGVVVNYNISSMVRVRRGDESHLVDLVRDNDFYVEMDAAVNASRFIPVNASDKVWQKAIGDREAPTASEYSILNCELSQCCAEISAARDILYFCKQNKGLIVHDREALSRSLAGHSYDASQQLRKILRQLELG